MRPFPPLIGLAALTTKAFRGESLRSIEQHLADRLTRCSWDASALMDVATLALLQGRPAEHQALQAQALSESVLYRHFSPRGANPIRLLALMTPGDFLANTPVDFLLQGSGIGLDYLYLTAEAEWPVALPGYDAVMVCVGESESTVALLERIRRWLPRLGLPVINQPDAIVHALRDLAGARLSGVADVAMPPTWRLNAADVLALDQPFPLIIRPLDSHAGKNLEKVDDAAQLAAYCRRMSESHYFVTPFVDYRSADGCYRKYRIALVDGVAYAVHMAISRHWMVHYLNADMLDNAANRAEEAAFMAGFAEDFAKRHQAALAAIHQRMKLDYLLLDCAELPDGRLLVFEFGNAMIVHDMDPPAVFPYKGPAVAKIFRAFQTMVERRATSGELGQAIAG
jgi:hypothetical protein